MPPDPNILILLDWLGQKGQEIRSLCPEALARIETLKSSATAPGRDLRSGHRLELADSWRPFVPTVVLSPEAAEENPFFDGCPAVALGLFDRMSKKTQAGFVYVSNGRSLAHLCGSWIDTDGTCVVDRTTRRIPLLPPQARSLIRLLLEMDASYGPASERIRHRLLEQVRSQAA